MQWLNNIANEAIARKPDGDILIESGVSPSGTYHVGTLREVLTCDAILLELRRRGRTAKHVHYVDDLDVFRRVPANVPPEFEKYLGRPVCDIPAPDGSKQSYADYFLNDFLNAAQKLRLDMDVIRSHQKYRGGFMVPAIEKALTSINEIRQIIEEVSGRKLEKEWAPIQVLEEGYLKNRRFSSIDMVGKTVAYLDADGSEQSIGYQKGEVKLNWRVDWPARWWLLHVDVEPFGRDHGTKGGSYDTGAAICQKVFGVPPPVPLTYNFINRSGETKKMSKSTGEIIAISEMTEVLPAEVIRFFTLRHPAEKQLFFDPQTSVTRLVDEFAELLAKPHKSEADKQLLDIVNNGVEPTVSSVPFSHLTASYQAALKNPQRTLDIIKRTEHGKISPHREQIIQAELGFIDQWLARWAPEDVKFELARSVNASDFSEGQKAYLGQLAGKIEQAPESADGQWFHKAIYELIETGQLSTKEVFEPLYMALIGRKSGPRAGWFLSILDRDWLIKRLRLET